MQREYLGYVFLALLYEENMSENCCKITPEEIALIGSIIVIVFQLNWANAEEGDARIEFLDYIINYCERLKRSGNKKSKPKTRHGAGGKAATKEVT
jgi:hypothetical protein